MIEKHGDINPSSHSDIDTRKLAKYGEEDSELIVGEDEKHFLKKPVALFHGPDILLREHMKKIGVVI